MSAVETVEQAQRGLAGSGDAEERTLIDGIRSTWFVGDTATVRSDLAAFAAQYGVDEIMISPVAGAYDAEPLDETIGRVRTIELLASGR